MKHQLAKCLVEWLLAAPGGLVQLDEHNAKAVSRLLWLHVCKSATQKKKPVMAFFDQNIFIAFLNAA